MSEQTDRARDLKEVGKSAVSTVLDRVGRGVGKVQERTPLPYDLLESEDAYLVVFDAPGATRSDIQVRFNEGAVEVRVDRFRDFHEGFEMRFPGRGLALDGRATLPAHASVDARGAEATLTDEGTLQVRVPKTELESATSVTIDDEESEAEDVASEPDEAASEPEEFEAGTEDEEASNEAGLADDGDAGGGDADDEE
ncbi:Hsp20/alpha crystallin family protein [Halorarum halobium]|uniref:Hsp20/alpha crystallin family protein n=1 Tax=Halorarum halobium TaxID=3075121 RepID=UPI0028A822F5|nr:Hsp20 family protein [Halobaculum sp. XH14]